MKGRRLGSVHSQLNIARDIGGRDLDGARKRLVIGHLWPAQFGVTTVADVRRWGADRF